jgi:methyl-accepting chemotaxis protein
MTQQVGTIRELLEAVKNVSDVSKGISAATEEQATNAKQVSKAIEVVNETTQTTAV